MSKKPDARITLTKNKRKLMITMRFRDLMTQQTKLNMKTLKNTMEFVIK